MKHCPDFLTTFLVLVLRPLKSYATLLSVVLGLQPRAQCMLGNRSTAELCPSRFLLPLIPLVIPSFPQILQRFQAEVHMRITLEVF